MDLPAFDLDDIECVQEEVGDVASVLATAAISDR
jgi:hypothetical protein